jgi:hypothetical protein
MAYLSHSHVLCIGRDAHILCLQIEQGSPLPNFLPLVLPYNIVCICAKFSAKCQIEQRGFLHFLHFLHSHSHQTFVGFIWSYFRIPFCLVFCLDLGFESLLEISALLAALHTLVLLLNSKHRIHICISWMYYRYIVIEAPKGSISCC